MGLFFEFSLCLIYGHGWLHFNIAPCVITGVYCYVFLIFGALISLPSALKNLLICHFVVATHQMFVLWFLRKCKNCYEQLFHLFTWLHLCCMIIFVPWLCLLARVLCYFSSNELFWFLSTIWCEIMLYSSLLIWYSPREWLKW